MPRRALKRKTGNCFDIDKDWADKLASSDKGSYYTQQEFKEVVSGNCVAVILWFYSSVLIIQTKKKFVLFPIQFINILYPASCISGSISTALGVSFSLESVVVA